MFKTEKIRPVLWFTTSNTLHIAPCIASSIIQLAVALNRSGTLAGIYYPNKGIDGICPLCSCSSLGSGHPASPGSFSASKNMH